MANEFVARNGIIARANSSITGTLDVSGNITSGGVIVATRTWVTSTALTGYATESYVTTAINNLVDAAPGTLDTLNELAAALGDDPNFATTVTNSIATKLPLAGGSMTGDITWTSTDRGLVWTMNTDGAYIKFFNTGDGDTNSRLEYATSDNGNEYHRWMVAGTEKMNLKWGGLTVADSIWMSGNLVATQSWVGSQNYLTAIPDEYLTQAEGDGLYAPVSHTHSATDITSGTLSADRLSGTYAINISGTAAGAVNADTVDGYHASQLTKIPLYTLDTQSEAKSGFVSGGNWYRIANLGTERFFARVRIYDDSSGGPHSSVEFQVAGAFNHSGNYSFTLTSNGYYSAPSVTQVRILSQSTYDPQYLEVYISYVGYAGSTFVVSLLEARNATVVNWEEGDVPAGYTATTWDANGPFATGGRSAKINTGAVISGGATINGSLINTGASYLGIIYDYDDNAYYLNPSGDSLLKNLSVGSTFYPQATQFFVNQTSQLNVEDQSTFARLAFNKLDFYDWQWGSMLTLENGTVSTNGTVVATNFVDYNDNNYYVNPASDARLRHLYVGDVAGSNDGSWNARMKVIGSSHARLDVVSNSDGIITTMYSHTGHGAGKVGTYSDHPLKFIINGSDKATLDSSGNLSLNGSLSATGYNSSNWDTAYSWGNHSGLYLPLSGGTITTSSQYGVVINHSPALGDFVDALLLRSTTSGNRAQIGFATVDTDGDHHRASIRAYKGSGTYEGVFGIAVRQTNATHVQRLTLSSAGNLTIDGQMNATSLRVSTSANNTVINGGGDWGVKFQNDNGYIHLGPANNDYAHIYTDRPSFYFNVSTLYAAGNTIWHAGNDGSGSGLDADTVDGLQASVFATRQDGARYSTDFNDILASGFYNAEGSPPNAPGHYGQLIVAKGIDTAFQIYGGYDNNALWFRGQGYGPESGGFYPWRRVWHDGDFSSTNISNWNTAYGWGNHASAGYATTSYVTTAIANLVDAAPSTLDTLNELAAALGDDPNFATTVTNSIATKLPLAGGTMTGQIVIPSIGTGTYDGGIQLREQGYVGNAQSAWGYAPAITFHWGNRYAKKFGMRGSDGQFAVDDAPIALQSWVTSQGYLTSYQNNYISDVRLVESNLEFTGQGSAFNGNIDLSTLPFQPVGSYLTAEADTLATVTARGANTSTQVGLNAGWSVPDGITNYGSHFQTNDYTTMNFFSRAWQSVQGTNGLAYNFTTHSNAGGGGYGALQIYYGESGYVYAPTSFRAPIFYDSQDTNYYLDPASTSVLYTANITNTYVGNAIYFNGGNNYLNWTNNRIFTNVDIQAADVVSSNGVFASSTDGGRDCYLAIGDDNPTEYGIGYGGTFRFYGDTAQSASILYAGGGTFSGHLAAPIFYDSNDSNYYVDPNGMSKQIQLTNLGTYGSNASNARNHFVQYNAGNASPAGGWIAAAFGDATNNRVVIGQAGIDSGAVIAGHNSALDDWASLTYAATEHIFKSPYWGTSDKLKVNSDGVYAPAYRGNANVGGTGTATWHPDGIYCGSTMWQYGAMYKNNTWIYDLSGFTNATNSAEFRPNNGSYGSWIIGGSRNGWRGIEFESGSGGNLSMMVHVDSNTSGFHNNSYGWHFKWSNGTLYVGKNSYGGGTEAAVLDSSNYTSYAATSTQGSQGATAYSWGNHANYGYWNTDLGDPKDVQSSTVRFVGDVEVQGTFTETSSIRYKENIVDLEPATEKVEQLRPVRYNKIGSEVEEIGLIAEEVAEIYPEVVTYNDEGQPDGINYTRLSVVLLKTVQELSERINKLESK